MSEESLSKTGGLLLNLLTPWMDAAGLPRSRDARLVVVVDPTEPFVVIQRQPAGSPAVPLVATHDVPQEIVLAAADWLIDALNRAGAQLGDNDRLAVVLDVDTLTLKAVRTLQDGVVLIIGEAAPRAH